MRSDIFISHQAGRCPVCGAPILDCGYSDDPALWEHDWSRSEDSRAALFYLNPENRQSDGPAYRKDGTQVNRGAGPAQGPETGPAGALTSPSASP